MLPRSLFKNPKVEIQNLNILPKFHSARINQIQGGPKNGIVCVERLNFVRY